MSGTYKTIVLKVGKDGSLRRRHPWIFSGAIEKVPNNLQEGDTVRVVDSKGGFMCIGHFAIGSIAVRVLSFEDKKIDEGFWYERIDSALRLRRSLGLCREDNTIYRLVHGEGDGLPGLIVDVYGETVVIQAHSVGMHREREAIARVVARLLGNSVNSIYYKSDQTLPFKAGCNGDTGYLLGHGANRTAVENGLKFAIDYVHGQKTGFFIDQRDNRSLLERYATGRKVLNMFCYTGGFSVYALRGGASEVHSVDSSARAMDVTAENVELNFGKDCDRHRGTTADAFEFLAETSGDWDMMVVDPPAFAKHREAVRNALKGYIRLNAAAMEKMNRNSILFTFSCSQAIDKEQFRLAVFTAATKARRNARILHQLHQPADHPINIFHPEGEYLKGLVVYVE